MLDAIVFLVSLWAGRDPQRLHFACRRAGLDTRRADVREAIMARAKL